MNRRAWMALGMAAAGCRRKAEPVAVVAEPEWQGLADSWEQVMGGELSRPEEGVLRLQWGESLSAMKWTGPPLTLPFEIELEARRVDGTDFFCGLTFPARASGECLTWVVGGWGGGLVGISSLDDKDASENGTARPTVLEKGRWYRLRLARLGERLEAWIDGTRVVDLDTTGRKLSLRPGPIDCCAPFGLATWQTTGEFRTLRWRTLKE
ncbi:DUF1080 domain-containing protein [Luteolibacter sp. Populi]|uniref:DUF1080 domain-containing protein n=1 Tax=Luteolibacter sp. Populi TaxID=3230487 RepID=UPI003465473B